MRTKEPVEKIPTVEGVLEHMRARRDEFRNCIMGFSGGKDSLLLLKLVEQAFGERPPLYYASCPGCEWPEHLEFVRSFGATIVDSGHDWDWYEANDWAFLHNTTYLSNRWGRIHQRATLRKLAKSMGKVLLWGNRLADRNQVQRHRYRGPEGAELWMPLRDIPNHVVTDMLEPQDWSPVYQIPTCGRTGYAPGMIRKGTPEQRREEARARLSRANFRRFEKLWVRRNASQQSSA